MLAEDQSRFHCGPSFGGGGAEAHLQTTLASVIRHEKSMPHLELATKF